MFIFSNKAVFIVYTANAINFVIEFLDKPDIKLKYLI